MSAESLAMIIGLLVSTFSVFVFYMILETLIFKRIADDPVVGKLSAVAAAWIAASIFYGVRSTETAGFDGRGFIYHIPATALVAIYAYRRGLRIRKRDQDAIDSAFE